MSDSAGRVLTGVGWPGQPGKNRGECVGLAERIDVVIPPVATTCTCSHDSYFCVIHGIESSDEPCDCGNCQANGCRESAALDALATPARTPSDKGSSSSGAAS